MTSIVDRYASAVRSGNLKSKPDTEKSDSDVVGAWGLMAKQHPLAAALGRLLEGGDNHATSDVVRELAAVVEGRAYRTGVEITRTQAEDMSRAVLAWYRHGTCQACHGHGYELIEGAPALSGNACKRCKGTRRIPFARQFAMERQDLAGWVLAKVEREIALAGPAALARLAPRLSL